MPRSLYDGNIKLTVLPTEPADPLAITLAELEDGVDVSCAVLRNGYRFSATGSDPVTEPALCTQGNAIAYGPSNYEFSLQAFRYRDESGHSDPAQDIAYDVFGGKGTILRVVERIGPPARQAWAEDDEYRTALILLDDRQQPTELTGYEKFVQPGAVQDGIQDGVVAA